MENKYKVLLVFGTRPEAIKMVPLVKAMQADEAFQTYVCVTGQHRQMLDQVLSLFNIIPDFDLNIMKSGQDLYDVTTGVLNGMKNVLSELKPDLVLVHGDTSTSTTAALASFYSQIPVGHVEAGLRTHNIYSPWPEEMNRQITARLACLHFAPTTSSYNNLLAEHIDESSIFITGNTVIDTLKYVDQLIGNDQDLRDQLDQQISESGYIHNDNRKIVLITGHRRENFGEGFKHICLAIKKLAEMHPGVDFVYPMHMNPNVRNPIKDIFSNSSQATNVYFIEPLGYFTFIRLMSKSYFILTDSGGIQEEAPGLGKPVLVMRNTTERPEAVESGAVKLVGTDLDTIFNEAHILLTQQEEYKRMSKSINPYGDGTACEKIITAIKQRL